MRRWFKSARTYIFVAPVAVAMSDDGGCASSGQKALDPEQVKEQVVGNTVRSETNNAVAFIAADGSIRAEVSATDSIKTDLGKWTLDDKGSFCVEWTETIHGKNNCSEFVPLEGSKLQWGGHTIAVEEGNTRDL